MEALGQLKMREGEAGLRVPSVQAASPAMRCVLF